MRGGWHLWSLSISALNPVILPTLFLVDSPTTFQKKKMTRHLTDCSVIYIHTLRSQVTQVGRTLGMIRSNHLILQMGKLTHRTIKWLCIFCPQIKPDSSWSKRIMFSLWLTSSPLPFFSASQEKQVHSVHWTMSWTIHQVGSNLLLFFPQQLRIRDDLTYMATFTWVSFPMTRNQIPSH